MANLPDCYSPDALDVALDRFFGREYERRPARSKTPKSHLEDEDDPSFENAVHISEGR